MRVDYRSFTKEYHRPPKNQFPTGSVIYKGHQGQGKTLSLVHDLFVIQKKFPNCVIFSNIKIKGFEPLSYIPILDGDNKIIGYKRVNGTYKFIDNDDILLQALMFQNGSNGVLIALDEAHLFFGKKTGISLDVLTAISQQRKDRKRLIFTSQIWEELDISLRKQVKEVISCRCILGRFQFNSVSDGETITWDNTHSCYTARHIRYDLFKHNQQLYDSYDTYQKILRNTEYERTPISSTHNSINISTIKVKR